MQFAPLTASSCGMLSKIRTEIVLVLTPSVCGLNSDLCLQEPQRHAGRFSCSFHAKSSAGVSKVYNFVQSEFENATILDAYPDTGVGAGY